MDYEQVGVLTNIPKLDSLGIRSAAQGLTNGLGGLDVASVVEGDQGAGLILEERLDIEAQKGPRGVRLDVVATIHEGGVELNGVARLGDQGPRCDLNN